MLRTPTILISLVALATPAFADDSVAIAPISFGDEIMEKVDDLGQRELDRLAGYLQRDLEQELAGHLGNGGMTLQVTILDADPNRPTSRQAFSNGLHSSSYSIGGADVAAELFDADGQLIESFSYSWQNHNIRDAAGYSTWSDARRTFDRFAASIGRRVDEQASNGS
jgi:hypothetical protein